MVGTLILDINQPLLIVADEGKEEEVITRLSRVGYDGALGYLKGGMAAWTSAGKDIDQIESVTVEEAAKLQKDYKIVDVRKASENFSEHVIDAINAPLDYVNDSMKNLDKNQTYLVHCAGGYRSVIFNSILRARGFDNLIDVKGGFNAIKTSGLFPVSDYVCPTTML